MAYVPSEALNADLSSSSVGIWLERLADGRTGLVCKIPETIIKAIYSGARTTLLLASVRAESLTILCLGLLVEDERERPFKASTINSSEDDKSLLARVLESHAVTLHCLNELNHPALSASCAMQPAAADAAAAALRASDHWILTPAFSNTMSLDDLSRILSLALDRFRTHIHGAVTDAGTADIGFAGRVPMTLDIWRPTEIFEVTPSSASGPFLIGDRAEGLKLENMILAILDSVYPGRAYVSPVVQEGKVSRELADALAFDDRVICVIQAKALAVLSANRERSSSRRSANVENDIRKGLKQLTGAIGNIRSRAPVSTRDDGTPITLPDRVTSPAHAILVLSEMYFGVDWKGVARLMAEAIQNEVRRALFHVLDIQELATLSRDCDSTVFSNRLIQRWAVVQEKGTCYVRTRLPL